MESGGRGKKGGRPRWLKGKLKRPEIPADQPFFKERKTGSEEGGRHKEKVEKKGKRQGKKTGMRRTHRQGEKRELSRRRDGKTRKGRSS